MSTVVNKTGCLRSAPSSKNTVRRIVWPVRKRSNCVSVVMTLFNVICIALGFCN